MGTRGSTTRHPFGRRASGVARRFVAFAVLILFALASSALFSGAGPAMAAGWVWPLDPRPEVVAEFVAPSSPWGPGHRGVDLLGTEGQQVRSAGAGTVAFAAVLAGRGVITVRHDAGDGSLRTTYEPVTAEVRVGQVVAAGEPIGVLDASPSHCAPRTCLHWGLLDGADYLDPLSLLADGPVRLLPLETSASAAPATGGTGVLTAKRAIPGAALLIAGIATAALTRPRGPPAIS